MPLSDDPEKRAKQLANLNPAKKGEVRNPKGRTNGLRNVKTILREFLNESDPDNPEITVLDATMKKLIKKARGGDLMALNLLLDRLEGKAVQKTKNENVDVSYEDYLKSLDE